MAIINGLKIHHEMQGEGQPTLLTVGGQDLVTPLSWQRQIAAGIANSRIRIIPNTAHMTMLESPAVFNTVLLDFLAALEL